MDHNFSNDDTIFGRYSIGTENGFSPSSGVTATTEDLPGFGANFDNRSQQAVISWNHIFAPNKVNTGSFAVSRLSMDRTSQNDGVNDIVGALGIQGRGIRRSKRVGGSLVRRPGLHRHWRYFRRYADACLGHDVRIPG